MIFLLLLIFILILALELPILFREKRYKEVVVFMGFYSIGVYLSIAFFYDWAIYNPFEAFAHLFPRY